MLSRVSIFPTVCECNTLSQHRRTSQVSAGRLHSGANGGYIARRNGGQRQAKSQPAVWPKHPGELPGQLQVRAPGQEAWGGEPSCVLLPQEAVYERWGSAALQTEGADAGSAEPLQLVPLSFACWSRNVLLSGVFYVWACLPPEDRDELLAAGLRHF